MNKTVHTHSCKHTQPQCVRLRETHKQLHLFQVAVSSLNDEIIITLYFTLMSKTWFFLFLINTKFLLSIFFSPHASQTSVYNEAVPHNSAYVLPAICPAQLLLSVKSTLRGNETCNFFPSKLIYIYIYLLYNSTRIIIISIIIITVIHFVSCTHCK